MREVTHLLKYMIVVYDNKWDITLLSLTFFMQAQQNLQFDWFDCEEKNIIHSNYTDLLLFRVKYI